MAGAAACNAESTCALERSLALAAKPQPGLTNQVLKVALGSFSPYDMTA